VTDYIVNVPKLREALATLKAHEDLIEDCVCNGEVRMDGKVRLHDVPGVLYDALYRIIEDDWRPS
jgi:hypothetical protein